MSDSRPAPRLPHRVPAGDDRFTWIGVAWLAVMAAGFLGLVMLILPISFPVLLGITAFIGLNVLGHYVLGRWVAKRISASITEEDTASKT